VRFEITGVRLRLADAIRRRSERRRCERGCQSRRGEAAHFTSSTVTKAAAYALDVFSGAVAITS
jgi:hypothetical protein